MGDTDDDDFAQPSGEFRLPADGPVMVEPGLRQRRAVQQQPVDVEKPAAAARLDASDDLRKLGMFGLFDQRNARHEIPATVMGGCDKTFVPSFRGSAAGREPGIHNHRSGSMDSGLAFASLRRPGMTGLAKVDTLAPRVLIHARLGRSLAKCSVHFSGSGMNSISSPGTLPKWPAAHSALACSIRSLREETKFHQMCRGPSMGAPPRIIRCASVTAWRVIASPGRNTNRRSG